MNKVRLTAWLLAFSLPGLMALPAGADSTQANCEFRKDGDVKKDASGPCTFSQRQGYVDITLKNGKSFNLSPGKKPNHFKDQEDHKVVRTSEGSSQKYKWDQKAIIVTFNGNGGGDSSRHSQPAAAEAGQTPGDLKDLVGAKAGQAEGQLSKRGYDFVKSSVGGDSVYANWRNRKSGQCIAMRTVDGRYNSITNTLPFDCEN